MYNLGLTPENGTLQLVLFISGFLLFLITFNIVGIMVRDSMVGDIADEVELQSGKRQEGILFATVGFMQKLNAGLGTFFAGQVLSFINFDRLNHTAEQAYTLAVVDEGLLDFSNALNEVDINRFDSILLGPGLGMSDEKDCFGIVDK